MIELSVRWSQCTETTNYSFFVAGFTEAIKIITFSATGDGSFFAVTMFSIQCIATELLVRAFPYTNFTWFIYNLKNVQSLVVISPIGV